MAVPSSTKPGLRVDVCERSITMCVTRPRRACAQNGALQKGRATSCPLFPPRPRSECAMLSELRGSRGERAGGRRRRRRRGGGLSLIHISEPTRPRLI
eukprot:3425434-Rhodomonas_salina.1